MMMDMSKTSLPPTKIYTMGLRGEGGCVVEDILQLLYEGTLYHITRRM